MNVFSIVLEPTIGGWVGEFFDDGSKFFGRFEFGDNLVPDDKRLGWLLGEILPELGVLVHSVGIGSEIVFESEAKLIDGYDCRFEGWKLDGGLGWVGLRLGRLGLGGVGFLWAGGGGLIARQDE